MKGACVCGVLYHQVSHSQLIVTALAPIIAHLLNYSHNIFSVKEKLHGLLRSPENFTEKSFEDVSLPSSYTSSYMCTFVIVQAMVTSRDPPSHPLDCSHWCRISGVGHEEHQEPQSGV